MSASKVVGRPRSFFQLPMRLSESGAKEKKESGNQFLFWLFVLVLEGKKPAAEEEEGESP